MSAPLNREPDASSERERNGLLRQAQREAEHDRDRYERRGSEQSRRSATDKPHEYEIRSEDSGT